MSLQPTLCFWIRIQPLSPGECQQVVTMVVS